MSNPEKKPEEDAGTSQLSNSIIESAAALQAYLSGRSAAPPFRPGVALPYNGTESMHPIITPPERPTLNVKGGLASYILAALLFSIAAREGALLISRMVIRESTASKREEPSNLKGARRTPSASAFADKTSGNLGQAQANQGAAVVTPSSSSHSAAGRNSQFKAMRPAQPTPGETKPWPETVKALEQLFAQHRATEAEGWKPQLSPAPAGL
jgi:hypothetical protein